MTPIDPQRINAAVDVRPSASHSSHFDIRHVRECVTSAIGCADNTRHNFSVPAKSVYLLGRAADDPLLRARAYPGYPERQVRGFINVPLISRRWRPTIVRTSRDACALVHRRDFGRILRSVRLRHPLVKSLQLLRILGAVPSN